MSQVIGHCPRHPGQSMLDCHFCNLDKKPSPGISVEHLETALGYILNNKRMKKVKLTITIEHEMEDNWYQAEGLSKGQRVKRYEEDFSDIEVLVNNIDRSGGWNVKAEIVG